MRCRNGQGKEHGIDFRIIEKFLHGVGFAHAMFGSFRAGALDVQIGAGGDLCDFGKGFEAVKVGVADRATANHADAKWRGSQILDS